MRVGVHFWVGDLVQRAFELGFEIKLLGLVADSERKTFLVYCQPLNPTARFQSILWIEIGRREEFHFSRGASERASEHEHDARHGKEWEKR